MTASAIAPRPALLWRPGVPALCCAAFLLITLVACLPPPDLLPLTHRLWTFVRLELMLPAVWDAGVQLHGMARMLHQGTAPEAQKSWEYALSLIGIAATIGFSLAALALRPRLLGFYGWFLTTAYVWLIATNLEGYNGLRLIYAASPASLGASFLLYRWPSVAAVVLVGSALALAAQTYLSFAGYWVV